MHAKLGPHDWAEVVVSRAGAIQVVRHYPCIRAVLYDATGRLLAVHHACFQGAVHLEGRDNPFGAPPLGGGYLRLTAFPRPPVRTSEEDVYLEPDGTPRRRVVPDVPMDDLQAVLEGFRVNLRTRTLERIP